MLFKIGCVVAVIAAMELGLVAWAVMIPSNVDPVEQKVRPSKPASGSLQRTLEAVLELERRRQKQMEYVASLISQQKAATQRQMEQLEGEIIKALAESSLTQGESK